MRISECGVRNLGTADAAARASLPVRLCSDNWKKVVINSTGSNGLGGVQKLQFSRQANLSPPPRRLKSNHFNSDFGQDLTRLAIGDWDEYTKVITEKIRVVSIPSGANWCKVKADCGFRFCWWIVRRRVLIHESARRKNE